MRSIRAFVDGLLGVPDARLYTVPDSADVSFELLTLIKPPDVAGYRRQVDFYEGYWAPEAEGTKVSHVLTWARRLLFRRPGSVPVRLRTLWMFLWAVLLLVVAVLVWERLDPFGWTKSPLWSGGAYLLAIALPIAGLVAASSLGDAARYFDDRPPNIALRQTVRRRIVDLLDELHAENRYGRIVVVGHSLGGIVAYDAVRLLWHRRVSSSAFNLDDGPVVSAAHALLKAPEGSRLRDQYREAQLELSRALSDEPAKPGSREPKWLVTDLVTAHRAPVPLPDRTQG